MFSKRTRIIIETIYWTCVGASIGFEVWVAHALIFGIGA